MDLELRSITRGPQTLFHFLGLGSFRDNAKAKVVPPLTAERHWTRNSFRLRILRKKVQNSHELPKNAGIVRLTPRG